MRRTTLSLMAAILALVGWAQQQGDQREVVIKVNGMFCPFCTAGIEKRLNMLPETADVRTDLAAGEAIVTLQPGAEFVDGHFADAIKRAGFSHSGIELREARPRVDRAEPGAVGTVSAGVVTHGKKAGSRYVTTIGGVGGGAGQFDQPMGIAFAPEGWFVVTDAGNARVQQFRPDGRPWRQWSVSGDGRSELRKPVGVAVDSDGGIWVTDYEADTIHHYGSTGEPRGIFGRSGNDKGEFDAPSGVAVTGDGLLAVADFYNHRVQLVKPDGEFVRSLGGQDYSNGLNYPTRVTAAPDGRLWVADAYNHRVVVFDPLSGDLVRHFGKKGHGPGEFDVSSGIALLPGERVAVVDFMNHRVQIWTEQGDFLGDFGEHGNGPGQFERPTDIALSPDGRLYVVDWGNHRLNVFTEENTNGKETER
ncbi:MAG: hypothetical protein HY706_13965 [Candidatus Hydrogenedentes bacterium]|nr:hypothetical protein [Candidatus Hydrogenedentota bacterium]